MVKKYSNEFKLMVVQDYYSSSLGVRTIAKKYNLPSKNYINRWEKSLKELGLLPSDATKPNKGAGPSSHAEVYQDHRTKREKHYEEEIEQLKAKIAYFEQLDHLQPYLKKN